MCVYIIVFMCKRPFSRSTAGSAEGYDSSNECPWYDTKQSNGEASVMLKFWKMWSIPSLPSLPGPLWPGVVAPNKGPIYGSNWTVWHLNCIYAKLNCLK